MQEYATMDTITGEKDLHVKGTLRKAGKYSFHMFNPPTVRACRVRWGACKRGMDGFEHCPVCYPQEVSIGNDPVE